MRRRKRALGSLARDIREHLDRAIEENAGRGMPPEEARREALRKFGNVTLVAEDTRAVWIPVWIEQWMQDVRYGLRAMRRNPGFAIVVILTLGLGIGMNTAVFSVVNAVLLRPLSYPDSDRLLWVSLYDRQWGEEWISDGDFLDWREQSPSFERLAAYDLVEATLPAPENARLQIARVSDDFWSISGARAEWGRLPAPGERDAVVLTYSSFERWFRNDPGVVGRSLVFRPTTRPFTVVGVLARQFRFEFPPGLSPFEFRGVDAYTVENPRRGGRGTVSAVAKLRRGIPASRVQSELTQIHSRSSPGNPRATSHMEVRVQTLFAKRVGQAPLALWVLTAAVVFVLLIACANIANLLLARSSARHREIAIRASVGAGRGRVLRQALVECTLVALSGGVVGLLLARLGVAVMLRLIPNAVPRLAETTMDGRVLAFALAASLLTAALFGLAPALALWRVDLHDVLKDGARTASATPASLRLRKLLVTVELALAVVLLSAAGLMIKSYWRMHQHPPGFEPEHILTAGLSLGDPGAFRDPGRGRAAVEELLLRLQSVPGILAASVMNRGPAEAVWEGAPPAPRGEEPPVVVANATSTAYPQVMGMRLVKGRWFREGENAIVVNESLARRDFGAREPLGQRLAPGGAAVVGVVADLKYSKLDAGPDPEFFVSYTRGGRMLENTVVIRTVGDPLAVAPAIRDLLAETSKPANVLSVATMEQALADSIAPRRFNLLLLGTFAAAALLMALIGVYGVIAYGVAQRTHEIGVRMALGARRRGVVGMVVRQGLRIAAAGIVLGLAAALALTPVMGSLLYDVAPDDGATLSTVVAALAVTSFLACWGPAVRAARVDPVVALRHE